MIFRKTAFILTTLICILVCGASADTLFEKYVQDLYDYEVIIPAGWKKAEVEGDCHSFTVSKGRSEIKIRAFSTENASWQSWFRGIQRKHAALPGLARILKGEPLSTEEGSKARLDVYQYYLRGTKYLQRTLSAMNGSAVYVVDCKSPVRTFYRDEELFNIALTSFKTVSGTPLSYVDMTQKTEALADIMVKSSPEIEGEKEYTGDFTGEARAKGFTPPKVALGRDPLRIFLPEDRVDPKKTIGDGVVRVRVKLPDSLEGNHSVYLWKNGEETLIGNNVAKGSSIESSVILVNGDNYFCTTLKDGNSFLARSRLVRLRSSVSEALARFEMTWNGMGDVDLHLDSAEGGWHVYYANLSVNAGGYNAFLDVDNILGFGPENIRIRALPRKTRVRCFVNYYSGRLPLTVNVRHYDRNNRLIRQYTEKLSPGDINSTGAFNYKSRVIGHFDIEP